MKSLLLILPSGRNDGHPIHYALAITRAVLARGWAIDLVSPLDQLTHYHGLELRNLITESGGSVFDNASPEASLVSVWKPIEYLVAQFRLWRWIRQAGLKAKVNRKYDIVYVDRGDGWYLPCAIIGSPITWAPVVTIMLRIRYHHESLPHDAGYPVRWAAVQRHLITTFLTNPTISSVITVDLPLIEQITPEAPYYERKLKYAPDMGIGVALVDRHQAKQLLGVPESMKVVVCLGRLDNRKGLGQLMSAVTDRHCPENIGVLLVGPHEGGLAELPRGHIAVKLAASGRLWMRAGAYTAEVLGYALSAADLVWLGYDGHPYSSSILWESAQSGVPVLGCSKGLIAYDIRSKGLGRSTHIDDPEGVAQCIKELVEDQTKRSWWNQNCQSAGAEHTQHRFGAAVAEVFEGCTQISRKGRATAQIQLG